MKVDPWLLIGGLILLFSLVLLTRPGYWDSRKGRAQAFEKKEQFRGGGGEAIGGRTAGPNNVGDLEDFRGGGGEAIGGRTAGPSNLGDLEEDFRGGMGMGGEAIGGRTAGPNNSPTLGDSAELLGDGEQQQRRRDQIMESFQNIGPAGEVTGAPEGNSLDEPAPASLDTPRKPYNLLQQLPPAPRGSISCLKASCCAETDFEWRTNQTGNYLQRTNNYKREFPDNCSGPLHELTLAFYKPTPLSKL
jgi:hypothetical protein